MVKKTIYCPSCGKITNEGIKDLEVIKLAKMNMILNNDLEQINKKLEDILSSHKTPYEKKIALFDVVKDLNVGESQPLKEQRMNYLLESRLYDMLAKKALEDYKKTTVKDFNHS
ncbi:MAG: hypothetical protein NY202_04460 [Mollicutes bacterium UO1]